MKYGKLTNLDVTCNRISNSFIPKAQKMFPSLSHDFVWNSSGKRKLDMSFLYHYAYVAALGYSCILRRHK